VPDAAEVHVLVGQLGDGDDVGVAVETGHEGVASDLPDAAGEGEEALGAEVLVSEEHHLVLQPGGPDLGHHLVVEVRGEVDAGQLGADGTRDGAHRDGGRDHGLRKWRTAFSTRLGSSRWPLPVPRVRPYRANEKPPFTG
jgi:hypothetical protein